MHVVEKATSILKLRPKNEAKRQRIAILEFVCGGGLATQAMQAIPTSLRREGRAMLRALATDWALLPDWDVIVSWDSRFGHCEIPGATVRLLDTPESFLDAWRSIATEVDFVLVIAPEIDQQLVEIVDALRVCDVCLLNADLSFLKTASDKWLTAQSLQQAKILHPKTALLSDVIGSGFNKDWNELGCSHWTIKPRDGAGCHEIHRLRSIEDVRHYAETTLPKSTPWNHYILQPWIEGIPGSVAVLCGPNQECVLPAMKQLLALDNSKPSSNVQYSGGNGPWQAISQTTLNALASRVVRSLPGAPVGWVGIDFIATELDSLLDSIVVIEVNPRLTTSYLGLRAIVAENLAGLLFQASSGKSTGFSLSGRSSTFDSLGTTVIDEL